jgi:hypothetical protein
MRVVEGIISDALGDLSEFANNLLPWMWENKFWFFAIIPIIALLIIAKWMWD